jgi:hypothetical protein
MRHWVNPIVNNGRMKGFNAIHCIYAGNEALKYLVGHRSLKVKEIITKTMFLRWLLMITPAQEKLECCMVMMAGSGLKSEKKKKKRLHSTYKLPCIDRAISSNQHVYDKG